jgi:hypothetical protein
MVVAKVAVAEGVGEEGVEEGEERPVLCAAASPPVGRASTVRVSGAELSVRGRAEGGELVGYGVFAGVAVVMAAVMVEVGGSDSSGAGMVIEGMVTRGGRGYPGDGGG